MSMIEPLEQQVKDEMVRLFSLRGKWAIPFFPKVFTAGLHSNERAAHIESFQRTQFKYEHTLHDQIDMIKKI